MSLNRLLSVVSGIVVALKYSLPGYHIDVDMKWVVSCIASKTYLRNVIVLKIFPVFRILPLMWKLLKKSQMQSKPYTVQSDF